MFRFVIEGLFDREVGMWVIKQGHSLPTGSLSAPVLMERCRHLMIAQVGH